MAEPKIWIMENVADAERFILLKPRFKTKLQRGKSHCFWGNFPSFLMPKTNKLMWKKPHKSRQNPVNPQTGKRSRKLASWINAKIPLACSLAFAKACKEALQ